MGEQEKNCGHGTGQKNRYSKQKKEQVNKRTGETMCAQSTPKLLEIEACMFDMMPGGFALLYPWCFETPLLRRMLIMFSA